MSAGVVDAIAAMFAAQEQHIEELMQTGGPVMWPLLGVSLLLWTLLFERIWFLYYRFPLLWTSMPPTGQDPIVRLTVLSDMKLELRRSLRPIRTLTGILPMLGLLGTVTGIVETFDLIRLFGSADASIIARGVSQALITTLSGLVMGLFGLAIGHQLARRVRAAEHALERWGHAR